MFNTSYSFNLIDRKEFPNGEDLLCFWLYNFNTDRRRYIVRVEFYKYNIYIIKYYAACHSKSKNRYRLLMLDEKAAPIIRTCIDIMLHFYSYNPSASFGFTGAPSINKRRKNKLLIEDRENTQRFRIYQTLMFNFFGKKTFAHTRNKKHSAYLMINRKNKEIRKFKKEAEQMFSKLYDELDF